MTYVRDAVLELRALQVTLECAIEESTDDDMKVPLREALEQARAAETILLPLFYGEAA
ncbi:MAG: hypothetical protein QOI71_285 [Gaiellales bacterium]|nr:hypothetical protein [Gaiellales bacterium]